MTAGDELLELRSTRGRLVLVTVILGSGIAMLDGTVVNIATRTIGIDLHAGLAQLQWVLNGYLLSLASLILLGSALGDRYGRRRIFGYGVAGFALTSLLCAIATDPTELIAFRVLQGAAGALLAPGSLALIQSAFRVEDRPAAIGSWAGFAGVTTALGPFVGGFLVENGGWRWVFVINLPLCVAVLALLRQVPESRDDQSAGSFDLVGAVLAIATLGGLTFLLTSWHDLPVLVDVLVPVAVGLTGWAFVHSQRRPGAFVDLDLFRSRTFAAANAMTLLVYGALGAVVFLLVLQLQVSSGYTPLEAGVATLPVTVAMLLFSARSAVVAARIGPRLPMTLGPLLCAAGVLLLAFVGRHASYVVHVLPGMLLFAAGLVLLVSPLTTAVLAAAPARNAGLASGINNALARTGSLLAVAALPGIVGLSGHDYRDPVALTSGYRTAELLCAVLLVAAAAVSWVGLDPAESLTEELPDEEDGYLEDYEYDDEEWEQTVAGVDGDQGAGS